MPFNEYAGAYKSRAKSIEVLDMIEKGRHGKDLRILKIDDPQAEPMILHDNNVRHKGGVILYPKGDEIGLAHELGHYKSGHLHSEGYYTFSREIEAVEKQIDILNNKGLYNKKAKDRIVKNLSTHSNKPYQKKRRALKAVKKIEARLGLL
jgi:hypothetical protein